MKLWPLVYLTSWTFRREPVYWAAVANQVEVSLLWAFSGCVRDHRQEARPGRFHGSGIKILCHAPIEM